MKALDYNGADHFVDKIYDLINSGGSADYIVEEGESGIWTYRKWASGIAECWGKANFTLNSTGTLWKTPIYAYLNITAQNYPFTFYEVPTETVSLSQSYNAAWVYKQVDSNNTTTKTAAYALIKVDAFDNNSPAVISYHVKGLWKEFTPSMVAEGRTPRAWNFTSTSSAVLSPTSNVFVSNGVAMGPLIFSNVTGTYNTYVTIGTTTDKPPVDFVLFPIYNGSTTDYIGVLRITQNGSVDIRVNTSTVSQSIYLNMLYSTTE